MRPTVVALTVSLAMLVGCGESDSPPERTAATPASTAAPNTATTAASKVAQPTVDETRVDIGGRALSLYCAGQGEPTVILDHGLHGSADDWGDALLRISADETSGQHTFTRVCSYDRAGRGESDRVAGIRTAEDFAADLDRLLKAARIARPVVLVGNGFASYHLRVFAARHPGDVAGMVFVDGYHPDMPRRFLRLLPADASKDGPSSASFARTLRLNRAPATPTAPTRTFDCSRSSVAALLGCELQG
jgi:pimeloyl-ACP methyl ester carboxylesterase